MEPYVACDPVHSPPLTWSEWWPPGLFSPHPDVIDCEPYRLCTPLVSQVLTYLHPTLLANSSLDKGREVSVARKIEHAAASSYEAAGSHLSSLKMWLVTVAADHGLLLGMIYIVFPSRMVFGLFKFMYKYSHARDR